MRTWVKVLLGIVAVLVVLLLVNALVLSNETKDAYVRDDGAQLVQTSNGTLQMLSEGDPAASPIVLIHCYTCSMKWWDDLAPMLSQNHRVIRLDLLGHGGSDKPGSGYGIDEQAGAVAEALAKLHVVNATVVGHSLGGSVATALAEQSPQLASRVVIIDQAPDDSSHSEPLTQKLSYWPIIGQAIDRGLQFAPKSAVRSNYDQTFAPGYNISSGFDNPDQPVDDLRAMTYTSYKETADAEKDFVDQNPLDRRLRQVGVPLLVIFGDEDQIYDAREAIDRYQQVPGAETHLIAGAGHSPNIEKPEAVAPLILQFAEAAPPQPQPTPKPKPAPKKKGPKKNGTKAKTGKKAEPGGTSAGSGKAPAPK